MYRRPGNAKHIHELKCWPEYLQLIREGRKTFEARDNSDREFREGDEVILRCWEPSRNEYTGETAVRAKVGYVLPPGAFGLPKNRTIFSLLDVQPAPGGSSP